MVKVRDLFASVIIILTPITYYTTWLGEFEQNTRNQIVAAAFAIIFILYSSSLFRSSLRNEQTINHYDLISNFILKSSTNAYREIIAYRVSSIVSIVFFSLFIFVKLADEVSRSNVMEVLLIFGGVLGVQIFHIMDIINREPGIFNLKRLNKKPPVKRNQVKLEGIVRNVQLRLHEDFELIEFHLEDLKHEERVEITYIHRVLSAAPQILEGSRIRLFGDYYPDHSEILPPLNLIKFVFPRVIIVEGYGEVEEIAYLREEVNMNIQISIGVSDINSSDASLESMKDSVQILKTTTIGETYNIDQIAELNTQFNPAYVKYLTNYLLNNGNFSFDYETTTYTRIEQTKQKNKRS